MSLRVAHLSEQTSTFKVTDVISEALVGAQVSYGEAMTPSGSTVSESLPLVYVCVVHFLWPPYEDSTKHTPTHCQIREHRHLSNAPCHTAAEQQSDRSDLFLNKLFVCVCLMKCEACVYLRKFKLRS